MKILFICQRLPFPPDKGERIRAFHQIRWLAQEHDVHVLALADSEADATNSRDLARHCSAVEVFVRRRHGSRARAALALAGRRPLTPAYFFSRRLARRAKEMARASPPDVVVACSSSTAQYALSFPETPKLLDMVDVDSAKWSALACAAPFPRSFIYALEGHRLRKYERRQIPLFDRIALTTARELEKLAQLGPAANAFVLPIGIDVDAYRAVARQEAPVPSLVFTGQMDYAPNIAAITHFGREVFPRLRRRRPTLELKVVGRRPSREVRALTAVAGIEVTGEVPEVMPYLSEAWLFVAPLRETIGVPTKILEAMAASVPTVATEAAARALDSEVQPGRDLLVARNDREFAAEVDRALSQRHLRERVGASGRRIACRCYAWRRTGRLLEEALREIEPRPRPVEGPAPAREIGIA